MRRSLKIFQHHSILRQIPIFSKLGWMALQRISRRIEVVEYKKGAVICRQGDPPAHFYCLVSGRVQAFSENHKGQKHNVEFIRRGMHFGAVSLLTGEPHSQTFLALNDSTILKIDREDFQAVLKSVPQLGFELSQYLSKNIRTRVLQTVPPADSTIIAIYSPIQGTGSSTYAVNLAFALRAESNSKVILVSIRARERLGDGKGGSAPHWTQAALNVGDIIDRQERIHEAIQPGQHQVDLLNVGFDREDASLVQQISRFVTTLAQEYHFVVVDLPNDMDDVVLKTLTQSDLVHLITHDQPEHLRMTARVINQLEEEMKENFRPEKVQVLLSCLEPMCYVSFHDLRKELDFDITLQLPYIPDEDLSAAVSSPGMSVVTPRAEGDYARAVRRMARQISGVRVGLVLGGGAALGLAHIGVLRVFEEEKIPVDIIAGSSMGALIGAMWATGMDSFAIERAAKEFTNQRAMLKLFDPVVPVSGLIGGKLIRKWLVRKLGGKTFCATSIPLKIIAYDLLRRHELVIDSGSLVDAVHKSISIPGVLEPVREHGQVIIDGGVLNPLPVNVLESQGIKRIIAVNVLQSPDDVAKGYALEQERRRQEERLQFKTAPVEFLKTRLNREIGKAFTASIPDIIVRSLQATEYVIAQQNAQKADVVIHPDLSDINWFELYKVDELIRRGEQAARAMLPAITHVVRD